MLVSQAVAALGEEIFGTDWAAPMSRLTGVNARTLLRIKVAASESREYPAAKGVLANMGVATKRIAARTDALIDAYGII